MKPTPDLICILFSPGKSDDCLSPDYVPSTFAHVKTPEKCKRSSDLEKFHRRKSMKKRKQEVERTSIAATALLALSAEGPVLSDDENMPSVDELSSEAISISTHHPNEMPGDPIVKTTVSVASQTDVSGAYLDALNMECENLRSEIKDLRKKVCKLTMDEETFKEADDEKVNFFTGLPNLLVLMSVFKLCQPYLNSNRILSPFVQFLATLMRLRLNLCNQYLAYRFSVSEATMSRIFNYTIHVIYSRLVPCSVIWPDREQLRLSMPMSFRQKFQACACVIDCFEVFIERPSDLLARVQSYSTYKSHNTIKYLIGITPQGVISFISKGWGGRTSDKYITEHSGFLDHILPGDLILADRGFDVGDIIGLCQASLELPVFSKGKKQLCPLDVEGTRTKAALRIHVERVIGSVRNKGGGGSGGVNPPPHNCTGPWHLCFSRGPRVGP